MEIRIFALFAAAAVMVRAPVAWAAGGAEPTLLIRDHKFDPPELHVPAGKRIAVTVENRDATPEEVESKALRVEKVIAGSGKGIVRFGPLNAGTYPFFGDFHQDTAQGRVVAE